MARKIEAILDARGVEYRFSGRFEILTRCPMCGASDPSQHLAISTRGRGWRCLRNPRQHRGKAYARLLTLLLNCSIEYARDLLGEQALNPLPDSDEFSAAWRKQLGLTVPTSTRPIKLELPREFRKLMTAPPIARGFWQYLFDRGYTTAQAEWAANAYDLHYALTGRYSYRVIIPVYSAIAQLMTWTGRSISPDAEVRYLTLRSDEARAPPGELLLGLPLLYGAKSARCLVVCEGPFDAIAVSTLGHDLGIWGTCLFGLELSDTQADLLSDLEVRFERLRLLLDPDAFLRVLSLREMLPRRCKVMGLPKGLKDPGVLIGQKTGREFVASLVA